MNYEDLILINEMIEREETMTYVIGVILCAIFVFHFMLKKHEDEVIKWINKCAPVIYIFLQVLVVDVFLGFMIGIFGWLACINVVISVVLIVLLSYPVYKMINIVAEFFSNHDMGKWVSVMNIIGVVACYARRLVEVVDKEFWGDMEWNCYSYIIIGVCALFCLYALFIYILKSIKYIIK